MEFRKKIGPSILLSDLITFVSIYNIASSFFGGDLEIKGNRVLHLVRQNIMMEIAKNLIEEKFFHFKPKSIHIYLCNSFAIHSWTWSHCIDFDYFSFFLHHQTNHNKLVSKYNDLQSTVTAERQERRGRRKYPKSWSLFKMNVVNWKK